MVSGLLILSKIKMTIHYPSDNKTADIVICMFFNIFFIFVQCNCSYFFIIFLHTNHLN